MKQTYLIVGLLISCFISMTFGQNGLIKAKNGQITIQYLLENRPEIYKWMLEQRK